jgi:FKBP-type peptidyl-prolyl cis-trans isomerase
MIFLEILWYYRPMKNLTAFFALLLLGTLVFAEDAAPAPSSQDVGYSIGLLMGQSLGQTGVDLSLDDFLAGFKAGLAKDPKARISADQAKQIANGAIQAAQGKAQAAQQAKEDAYLADHAKKAGVVTTDSGLQYEVLTEGKGTKPTLTDSVKVEYVGTLTDGTEFDSSAKQGGPAEFTLDQVIPAWTEGLQLMAPGAKYRFTIPSKLAYGPQGAGGVIPPFATLVFEVTLLEIAPPAPAPAPEAPAEDAPPPAPAPKK